MLNTATSYLAMLQEDDIDIKSAALDKINLLVDDYWSEISDYIQDLENLYQNKQIPDKQELLALILSKIYYNLEDYDSAIEWALQAGTKFNLGENNQFVNTIIKKILERYISIRKNNFFNENKQQIDQRINKIMERIFQKCIEKGEVNQAIGFSLETYDLDRVRVI